MLEITWTYYLPHQKWWEVMFLPASVDM